MHPGLPGEAHTRHARCIEFGSPEEGKSLPRIWLCPDLQVDRDQNVCAARHRS